MFRASIVRITPRQLGTLALLALLPVALPAQEQKDDGPIDAASVKKVLRGHKYAVEAMQFTPGGKLVAASLQNVKVWDVKAGEEVVSFKAHAQYIHGVAVTKDEKRLATASWDGTIKFWELPAGKELKTLETGGPLVHCLALSPDEKLLASGGRDKVLHIWDFPSGKLRVAMNAHPRDVQSVAFSRDGKMLASCGYDSEVKVWEAATGKPITSIPNPPVQFHWDAVAFSPDGQHLAMAGVAFRVVEVDGWKEVFRTRADEVQTLTLAYSPDSKLLATGGMDKLVRVWDARTGKELAALKGHGQDVIALAFSPDGRTLASAGKDGTIHLWPLRKPAAGR